ncbi:hypothetical protein BBJ28_00023092, partial [Nothophytophthora sp. Chile5]
VDALRVRLVSDSETELWPGSFVGQPIAFVHPSGVNVDKWDYGLVTGYTMRNEKATLHVRHMDESTKLALEEPPNVIIVDRLNYALQTGATVNVMSMNAHELLERQNRVMATLTIPYAPEEIVPLIHPDTLQVVAVRRQHVVQCEMQVSGTTTLDVFSDQPEPRITPAPDSAVISGLGNRPITGVDDAHLESEDDSEPNSEISDDDIRTVVLQHRPLGKRKRTNDVGEDDALADTDDVSLAAFDHTDDRRASSFQSSVLEKRVHNAIVHPSRKGTNPQSILEVIADGLTAAIDVQHEFSRHDHHLMELYQSQQEKRFASMQTAGSGRRDTEPEQSGGARPQATMHSRYGPSSQGNRTPSTAVVPSSVTALLPKQGNKTLCIKHLSKKGCRNREDGQCFASYRAHFRPSNLPNEVKEFIVARYGGLAPAFQDL